MCEQAILDKEFTYEEEGEEVTVTLEGATREIIDEFVDAGETFTAYDVTKKLRAGIPWNGGKNHIAHDDVRNVVGHLYHFGAMGDWTRATDPNTGGAMRYQLQPEAADEDEAALLAADGDKDDVLQTADEALADEMMEVLTGQAQADDDKDEAALLAVD
jgi:hypothetical protein